MQLFHFKAISDNAELHFPHSLEKVTLTMLFGGMYVFVMLNEFLIKPSPV